MVGVLNEVRPPSKILTEGVADGGGASCAVGFSKDKGGTTESSCGSFATDLTSSFLLGSTFRDSTFRTSGLVGAAFSFFAVLLELSLVGSFDFGTTPSTGDGFSCGGGVNTGVACGVGSSCTVIGVGLFQSTLAGGLPNVEGNTGDSETPCGLSKGLTYGLFALNTMTPLVSVAWEGVITVMVAKAKVKKE